MGRKLIGSIEAGGTKFMCSTGCGPEKYREPIRISTTLPDETLAQVAEYFRSTAQVEGPCAAFGVASFGPLNLVRGTIDYGAIVNTPKAGWSGVNLISFLQNCFGVPIGLETDVTGAALAEAEWGNARGGGVAVYVTVGTGIGGGVVVDGRPVHGARHPEIGHITPRRHPSDLAFPGICPFHGPCFEGLVSGPAIVERWKQPLSALPPDHEAHGIVAWYLANLILTLRAVLSANRIIFGGGVMKTPGLFDRIQTQALALDSTYLLDRASFSDVMKPPALGDLSGLMGGFLIGEHMLRAAAK